MATKLFAYTELIMCCGKCILLAIYRVHTVGTVGNMHEEFSDLMNPSAHANLSNVAAAVAVCVSDLHSERRLNKYF